MFIKLVIVGKQTVKTRSEVKVLHIHRHCIVQVVAVHELILMQQTSHTWFQSCMLVCTTHLGICLLILCIWTHAISG